MEEIILKQLGSLQLYQVPVALRMTLLEDGLCLLNFWIFEIQNFCLPKLVFVFLEKRLYSNGHKPLEQGYWLRACCHKKLCTNPSDFAVFDNCLFVLFMSQSCGDQVPCKLLCEFLKRPTSSILIGSVRWRLTYH